MNANHLMAAQLTRTATIVWAHTNALKNRSLLLKHERLPLQSSMPGLCQRPKRKLQLQAHIGGARHQSVRRTMSQSQVKYKLPLSLPVLPKVTEVLIPECSIPLGVDSVLQIHQLFLQARRSPTRTPCTITKVIYR